MSKAIHKAGKRKRAIAKATLIEGKGNIVVNGINLNNYVPELYRLRMMEPLILAEEIANTVDINVKVIGGGMSGQADAARLAIGKCMAAFNKKLEKIYLTYDRQLLVADVRRKETCKPNDSKARASRQKSYR